MTFDDARDRLRRGLHASWPSRMSRSSAGERVLITGDPGAGKTLFFRADRRAVAVGQRSHRPAGGRDAVTFIPRTPYFPPGTLRAGAGLSARRRQVSRDAELDAALEQGRPRRGSSRSLDQSTRWERELNEDEQRLLAFARLALHKPRWVVIDEALDTLGGRCAQRVFAVLEKDLAGATIVNIGLAERNSHFFTRVLHLAADPKGHALKPMPHSPAKPHRRPEAVAV